jgi:stage V sporulation protein G
MNKLEISEIQILPVKPQNGLIAFCSFVLNNQFYIGDVAIYGRPSGNGLRLVYPNRRLANGKAVSCIHPISKDVGDHITEEVLRKYRELVTKM